MPRRHLHRPLLLAAAFAAVALAGCSGRYPVTGKVTYEDGTPVPEGTVIGEATVNGKLVGVQGNIRPDGSYSWGGDVPGDGALPGEYKVLVVPPQLGDAEMAEGKTPAVDGKFTRYQSSGLKFTVEPKVNTFDITVTRPKPKGK
jgi:hypothetical protein